ncbi:MAG: hypothetical protein OHK006_13320 [Thermodesulfovibrionales bacterium]
MADTAEISGSQRELASPMKRFLAALIDGVLEGIVSLVPFVGIVAALAYGLIKDALPFLGGQSIGKKAMGIRALKLENGAPLTNDYATSVIRQVSLCIPLFNIADALMVFTKERRRFGDKWAKTVVVTE